MRAARAQPPPPADWCVVSAVRGSAYAPVAAEITANKKHFCAACGFRCLLSTQPQSHDRPPAWDKIPLMLEALQQCTVAMWVDADVVFLRPFVLPPPRVPLTFMADANGLNTGVMLLTAGAEPFLRAVWEKVEWTNHSTWEQQAVRDVLLHDNASRSVAAVWNSLVWYGRLALQHTAVQKATPLYHAAGCFSSRSKYQPCYAMLRAAARNSTVGHHTCARFNGTDERSLADDDVCISALHCTSKMRARRREAANWLLRCQRQSKRAANISCAAESEQRLAGVTR